MTAVNIITQRDRLIILTDTVGYDTDGTVAAFYNKCVTVPHLRMALATRGSGLATSLVVSWLCGMFQSFDAIADDGGEAFARIYDNVFPILVQSGETEIDIVFGGWSERRNRPMAFLTSSSDRHGFTPFELQEPDPVHGGPLPPDDLLAAAGIDDSVTAENFDPVRHGLMLMNAQRAMKVFITSGEDGEKHHCVGGQAVLTEIRADGISQRVIHRWNDRIDEPIRPGPLVKEPSVVPLSRQQRRAMEREQRKIRA